MSSNILLITGTDTGIGKTTVGTLLTASLRELGVCPAVMKPIETGCALQADGNLLAADAELLWNASGKKQQPARVAPFRFKTPAAPLAAARVEGRKIAAGDLVLAVQAEAAAVPLCLVEGAGGLLVPIAENYTFADLAWELNAVLLVVVGSRLGALNHAALTFEVLRGRKLPAIGYVLNEVFPVAHEVHAAALETNRAMLQEIAGGYELKELCFLPFRDYLGAGEGRSQVNIAEIKKASELKAIQQLSHAVIEYFALNR